MAEHDDVGRSESTRTQPSLDDLIAKLEAAPEGSRAFDAEIHAAMHGGYAEYSGPPNNQWVVWLTPIRWEIGVFGKYPTRDRLCNETAIPHYTTSLDVKLPDERIVQVHGMDRGQALAQALIPGEQYRTVAARGATEALARRAAALKARRDTEPTDT